MNNNLTWNQLKSLNNKILSFTEHPLNPFQVIQIRGLPASETKLETETHVHQRAKQPISGKFRKQTFFFFHRRATRQC